ncbi:MAG: molybdenum cofactor guanylyltransferase [Terriglobia bacterium]|jgi:molybdopterin-guanine dinucleotide biosynthesis protein A
MMEGIDGFVLASGKSSRMGQDKALMRLEGRPLVLRAMEILRPFVDQITLLAPAGRYDNLGLPVVADKWPDQGPLAAVCTGLLSSPAAWNIFLACDLPLVSRQFLQLLVKRVKATRSDAVVPRTKEGWQPLSAAYHSRCRTVFARAIQEGRRSFIGLFEEIPAEVITHDEMVSAGVSEGELTNVNTPEDWARIAGLSKGAP